MSVHERSKSYGSDVFHGDTSDSLSLAVEALAGTFFREQAEAAPLMPPNVMQHPSGDKDTERENASSLARNEGSSMFDMAVENGIGRGPIKV